MQFRRFFVAACDAGNAEMAVLMWCYRLQTEYAHYRTIADEAYRLLTEMRERGILSQSQAGQLCEWLDLFDEVCFAWLLLWQFFNRLFEMSFSLLFSYSENPMTLELSCLR